MHQLCEPTHDLPSTDISLTGSTTNHLQEAAVTYDDGGVLPDYTVDSTGGQHPLCPDNVIRNYSDMLKDLLSSTVASPVALEPVDQSNSNIWDFFLDSNEEMIDIGDISLLDLQPVDFNGLHSQTIEPHGTTNSRMFEDAASTAATEAFRASGWDWGPSPGDSSSAETSHLILPSHCAETAEIGIREQGRMPALLKPEDRNRLLSLLLQHCVKEQWIRIAPTFPSELFLDQMIRQFFAHQRADTVPWFHIPSFRSENLKDELLAAMVGIGACLSSSEAVQRFGYVMPEILRYAVVEQVSIVSITSGRVPLHIILLSAKLFNSGLRIIPCREIYSFFMLGVSSGHIMRPFWSFC